MGFGSRLLWRTEISGIPWGKYVSQLLRFLKLLETLSLDDGGISLSRMHFQVIGIVRFNPGSAIDLNQRYIVVLNCDAGKSVDGGCNEAEKICLVWFDLDV